MADGAWETVDPADAIQRLSTFDAFEVPQDGRRTRRYVLLDVFAERPLQGNQLAVFSDAREIDTEQMQSVARELKLSETIFVLPPRSGGDVRVRIFTPAVELPFAGHPLLGSAAVVARALERTELLLETGAGTVAVNVTIEDQWAASASMCQPIPTWEVFDRQRELLDALGLAGSSMPIEIYCNGPRHVLVAFDGEQAVATLTPDSAALAKLGDICVSCFAGAKSSWKTRMFAPALGVAEDPATGSAAGPLVVHLARHERIAFGMEIEISQGVEIERPSLLRARVDGSAERIESVDVSGRALLVGHGELLLP